MISHFDFYRLKEAGIMADELAESLENNKTITVVEWGDVVEDVLPNSRIVIEFKPIATTTDERQITFIYPESWADLIQKLENSWLSFRRKPESSLDPETSSG